MGSRRPPGSDLPAPYESPWRRLGQDLQAVAASLRLRAWELLRRNRQGELWQPRFWPEALASLFWPLLLAGVLLLGLGLATAVLRPGPVGGHSPPQDAGPAGSERLAPEDGPPEPPGQGSLPLAAQAPVLPPTPQPQPESSPPDAEEPLLPSAPIPPLQLALADTAGSELIRAARAEPARALLVLQVDGAFGRLPAPERAALAGLWWQRAQELGYERFEILGPGNGLLARSAVVGAGLVLYEPPPSPAGDPA